MNWAKLSEETFLSECIGIVEWIEECDMNSQSDCIVENKKKTKLNDLTTFNDFKWEKKKQNK